MKKIFLISLFLGFFSVILSAQDTNSASKILNSMHMPMMKTAFSQSGDLEQDFLKNMIPHHQGAIDSSKLLIQFDIDKKLKDMAYNIIKIQEKEIVDFKDILENKKYIKTQVSEKDYANFIKKEKENSQKMMHEMHTSHSTHEDINKAYIKAMMVHHQGAVDSAKNVLKYSKDKTIRAIAENIIKTQEKEIKEFKKFLK